MAAPANPGVRRLWPLISTAPLTELCTLPRRRHAHRPADADLGRRAYVMANAHPQVLQAVSRVAPSGHDDGVAVVLEELLSSRT